MKLSKKQKEVISEMRNGYILHWIGGITPHCFLSSNFTFKVSISTCIKLEKDGLIKRTHNNGNTDLKLTKLGKSIQIG